MQRSTAFVRYALNSRAFRSRAPDQLRNSDAHTVWNIVGPIGLTNT